MAKKEDTATVVPEVKSMLSLNFTQNDLIEMAIENKLEEYENQLSFSEKEIDELVEQVNKVNPTFIKRAEAKAKSVREHTYALALAKLWGAEIKISTDYDVKSKGGCNSKDDENIIRIYRRKVSDLPTTAADARAYVNYIKGDRKGWCNAEMIVIYPLKSVSYTVRVTNEKNGGMYQYFGELKLTKPTLEKDHARELKIMKSIRVKLMAFEKIAVDYLQLKFGAKRFKAKFVRDLLSQSDEGKEVLKLIRGTGVNLIGDGKKS